MSLLPMGHGPIGDDRGRQSQVMEIHQHSQTWQTVNEVQGVQSGAKGDGTDMGLGTNYSLHAREPSRQAWGQGPSRRQAWGEGPPKRQV